MDKSTIIKTVSALAMACVSGAVLAHDADTIAFYPLTDGSSGASAVGTTILNDVDNAQFAGTPSVKDNGGGSGKVQFSSDAPAKYIFAGLGGVPVATNAQSLFFDGVLDRTNNDKEGGTVTFADLGTALSKLDEYTVEFFWKVDTNEIAGVEAYYTSHIYKPSVCWHDGSVLADGTSAGAQSVRVPCGTTDTPVSSSASDVNYQNEVALYSGTYAGYKVDTILDGKWHHIAVTYSKAKKLRRLIADYTSAHCNVSRNGTDKGVAVTNVELEFSSPLDFGNCVMRGRLACLRVTKRVLGVKELLYASNNENFYTDISDIVFHWGAEGETGAAATELVNRFAPTQNFHEANPDLFYFSDSWIVPTTTLYTGNGTGVSAFDGVSPTYTDAIPDARKRNVTAGEDRDKVIAENKGSVSSVPPDCTQRKSFGLSLSKDSFRHLATGESFTCECFCKFDPQAAVDAGAQKSYPWFTIMGAPDEGWSMDWRLGFDFSPRATGTEGSLNQWEYMRPSLSAYWVTAEGTSGSGQLVSKGGTYVTCGNAPFDNQWHHVAFVYDAATSNVTAYLDYNPWISATLQGPMIVRTPTKQSYAFGHGCSGYPGPFAFDEVRLTRKALKPEEFLHFNKPLTGLTVIVR